MNSIVVREDFASLSGCIGRERDDGRGLELLDRALRRRLLLSVARTTRALLRELVACATSSVAPSMSRVLRSLLEARLHRFQPLGRPRLTTFLELLVVRFVRRVPNRK